MKINYVQATKNFIKVLLLLGILFTLSGCMSPQERSGVSPLPQNRPASWESGRAMGMSLM